MKNKTYTFILLGISILAAAAWLATRAPSHAPKATATTIAPEPTVAQSETHSFDQAQDLWSSETEAEHNLDLTVVEPNNEDLFELETILTAFAGAVQNSPSLSAEDAEIASQILIQFEETTGIGQ